MNGREDIESYRLEQRNALLVLLVETVRFMAQIATPILLAALLWKSWP
jgi:hypothetical protein